MKRFALALALLLLPVLGWAQNFGNIKPNTFIGNVDPTVSRPATPLPLDYLASSPMAYGAKGTGNPADAAADTAAVQAAITAFQGTGRTLFLGPHKYAINAELTISQPIVIQGVGKRVGTYETSCPNGQSSLIINTNINAITIAVGVNGAVIQGVCFQMGTAAGLRTSGWAVKSQGGQASILDNSFIYAYDGIHVTGTVGYGQNNGSLVGGNVVLSPGHAGITLGANSSSASTTGTVLFNNQVACFATRDGVAGTTSAIGLLVLDASPSVEWGDNGPFACNLGTAITPGNGQIVMDRMTGVLGDSSRVANLYIAPATSTGTVAALSFYDFWVSGAWSGTPANFGLDRAIWIENPNGGKIEKISFVGGMVHQTQEAHVPAMMISRVKGILISGVHFIQNGDQGSIDPAIDIDNSTDVNILGNYINNEYQAGIRISDSTGVSNIINIIGNANYGGRPFVITAFPPARAMTILNNGGPARNCPDWTLTTGVTTYTLADAYDCYKTAGTGGDVWVIDSVWSSREVLIYAGIPTVLHKNVPAKGLCGSDVTLAAGQSVKLIYNGGDSCWMRP